MGCRVNIGAAQGRRGRQGARTAVAQVSADEFTRQFRMNGGEFEVEVFFARDLTHDIDHPGEPRI
jgi:hypothetical protein